MAAALQTVQPGAQRAPNEALEQRLPEEGWPAWGRVQGSRVDPGRLPDNRASQLT